MSGELSILEFDVQGATVSVYKNANADSKAEVKVHALQWLYLHYGQHGPFG